MQIMTTVRDVDRCIGHGRYSWLLLNYKYDGLFLFDHIVIDMEAGAANQWQRQGDQFKNHDGRQMSCGVFQLVEEVKGFN